jgi:hypothetical protein
MTDDFFKLDAGELVVAIVIALVLALTILYS